LIVRDTVLPIRLQVYTFRRVDSAADAAASTRIICEAWFQGEDLRTLLTC
jgi:hypothetical protein